MILFLALVSAVVGVWRGFTTEALSLLTLLAAIGLAWTFADALEPSLGDWVWAAEVRLWIARVIIFVIVLVARWPRVVACAKIDPAYGLERPRSDARRGIRVVARGACSSVSRSSCWSLPRSTRSPGGRGAPSAVCRAGRGSGQVLRRARHVGICKSSPWPNLRSSGRLASWRPRCRCESMCGLVGIVGHEPVNQALYDALTVLQHRGQDAAGIMTDDGGRLRVRKSNGLVRDVFQERHMLKLAGNVGLGHVRYPTAGSATRLGGAAVLRELAVRHLPRSQRQSRQRGRAEDGSSSSTITATSTRTPTPRSC